MRTFYSIYYNPTIYGNEPYLKDNKMFVTEIESEAESELASIRYLLKNSIKPVIEKRGFFKRPIKVYTARTEHGKLISRVIETLHIRKITIHHEKNY